MAGPADGARNDTPVLLTPRLELSFGRDEDADVLFPYVLGFRRVRRMPAYVEKRGHPVDGWQFEIGPGELTR